MNMAGVDPYLASLTVWPALLWLAWWLGERAQPRGVPRVSVYVAVGLLGSAIGLAPAPAVAGGGAALLAQFALALVLFELGCRIHLGWFRHNPWVLLIGVVQSVAIFGAVVWALGAVGVAAEWRPLVAAVAVAASPASLLRVAHDVRAAGQVTERALHLAAIQGVMAVLFVKGASGYWHLSAAGDWAQAVLSSAYAVVLSAALGVALAVVVSALVRGPYGSPSAPTVGYALALVWLTFVSDALRLSPMLAALSFGVLLRERRVYVANAQRDFGTLGLLLGVFLFVYVGSRMSWGALAQGGVWAAAGVVLAARLGIPVVLNAVLAVPSGTTVRKGALTGVALLPMSAMTLLLLERSIALGLPPAAEALWHLTAALLWLELLGPWLTQWALVAAREAAHPTLGPAPAAAPPPSP
ncbi:Sodium/hydrogen exchanger family protein [Tepidimonas thermarum]|uniref:Sodium/hydrogen exchanger family protein n=2 Tax=Tepidimonas thermarum TaxID=335431 RepID=A0A554WYH2_9BURK|nr:Sodium/hydrogen exchanger family protein [Tepidimonas thermarum]